jgi:hypothetical protein
MDYFSEIQTGSEGMPDANGNGNDRIAILLFL